jgi:PAS domain S-box-containing protein
MTWQPILYALPSVVAVAIALVVARAAWQRRSASGAVPLVFLMLSVALWSAAEILRVLFPTLEAMYFFMQVEQIAVVGIPAFWVIFALDYAGFQRWLTRRNLIALAVIEAAIVLVAFTNPWHGWMWSSVTLNPATAYPSLATGRGPWWTLNILVNYPLIVIGTLVIGWTLADSWTLYRRQAGIVLVGVLVTWATDILFVLKVTPENLNLMPLAFSLGGACFWWGFYHFRMLDLMPVARAKVIESMVDAVIVLDRQNRIADLNPSAQKLLGLPAFRAVGQSADQCLRLWPQLGEHLLGAGEANNEVTLTTDGAPCSYDLRLSPLTGQGGRITGRLLVLRDITDRKRAEDEVLRLNTSLEDQVRERTQELSSANARLQSLSRQLVEVQENERRRLALDLHDELGQLLSSVKLSLDLVAGQLPPETRPSVQRVTALVTDLIQRVRELAVALRPSLLDDVGLAAALRSLCHRRSADSSPRVSFQSAMPEAKRFPAPIETTAYRIAQEGLTNALRHSHCEEVSLELRLDGDFLVLEVTDTGVGFVPDEVLGASSPSTGLSGMRERSRLLGGELLIDSAPGRGTRLVASLPIGDAVPARGASR